MLDRALTALLVLGAPVLAQQAIFLPPGGNLQTAIDAAAAGDTLYVPPGNYAPFVLDKAVDVIGAGVGQSTITRNWTSCVGFPLTTGKLFTVRSIPAGASVHISGFSMVGDGPTSCLPAGAFLEDCDGTVVLESLEITSALRAVVVENCELVLFDRCTLDGSSSGSLTTLSFSASTLSAEDATVWVVDSTVKGGTPGPSHDSPGGAAVWVEDSVFYGADSRFLAGDSQMPTSFFCSSLGGYIGTPGRAAMYVNGPSCIVRLVGSNTVLSGGDAAAPLYPAAQQCFGSGGAAIVVLTPTAFVEYDPGVTLTSGLSETSGVTAPTPTIVAGPASPMAVARPTIQLVGGTTVAARGNVGTTVSLFYALGLGPDTILGGFDGAVVLDLSRTLFLATIPMPAGAGAWALPPIPTPLPSALYGLELHLQGVEFGAGNFITNPISLPLRP